ncbi:unnamed protein product [Ambrosiozyma monospora]|uniref:Unnamed protein product n=1 Tax=Ambrosiozyma monospora TaxID=43982 RepID=A0ACB5TBP4_AMBMO|nr:unnamed protein product [Ambrosiozyma monospora]
MSYNNNNNGQDDYQPQYNQWTSDPQRNSLAVPGPSTSNTHRPRSSSFKSGHQPQQYTTNAAPATPRMLRNASSSNNMADDYTTAAGATGTAGGNDNMTGVQRTPSSKRGSVNYQQYQQQQAAQQYNGSPRRNTIDQQMQAPIDDAKRGLLPGVDFEPQSANANTRNVNPGVAGNVFRSNSQHKAPKTANQQQQQQQSKNTATTSSHDANQQFHRKAIGDWDFAKTIGAGSMGKVKLARHRVTNEICAVKIIPRAVKIWQRQHANDRIPTDPTEIAKKRKDLEKEVARDKRTIREGALGRILYHPYICRLYEMFPMTNHYYMLFEYVSGGQMLDFIVSHGSLKERHARKFCRD